MKNPLFFSAIGVLFCITTYGQNTITNNLPPAQKKRVDSLTAHWNNANKPGGAIAIIHKGELVYQNARGYAQINSSKQNTVQTAFPLAQISQSMVAYALLQLEAEGELSLDDYLSKHLPDLPDWANTIKVEHLLQQSTGIHDFVVLQHIAGWNENDRLKRENAIRLIKSQKQLYFTPGTEVSFSRSNLFLVSEIIERVSGSSLPKHMEEHIFKPLGMVNTLVLTAENQNDPRIAKSYRRGENDAVIPIHSRKETYAEVNIAASIEDMAKWELHLLRPKSEKAKATVKKFNNIIQLQNGMKFSIPSGELTYGQKYMHKERGLNTAMSTGGIDGYASAIFNFPIRDFTAITLSNNGEPYNGYIGMLSAHSFLDGLFPEPPNIDFSKIKTIKLDLEYHKKYEGTYWDAEGELSREIKIVNDTLRYIRSNGHSSTLIPLTKDKFQMLVEFDDRIILTFDDQEGSIGMKYRYGDATPFEFVQYTPLVYEQDESKRKFTGNYYCKELGIGYHLSAEKESLVATHVKADPIHLSPITNTIFAGNQWYMGSIEFQESGSGSIEGFYIRNDAIRNLWFKKME